MNALEERLDQAAADVRHGANRMQVRPVSKVARRHRRTRTSLIFVAASVLVLTFVGLGSISRPSREVASSGMTGSQPVVPPSVDAIDEPVDTTIVYQPPSPGEGDWVQLAPDLWIAWIPEPDGPGTVERLWVKTDIEEPTPAPSTNIRRGVARTGSGDLLIFVVETMDNPFPGKVTVTWTDGTSDTADLLLTNHDDVAVARFPGASDLEPFDIQEMP